MSEIGSGLRDLLGRYVDSGRIPGAVALVSRGEEVHVETAGTMRHDGGPAMRRDAIFRMASTTKPVTMAAAMVLLDECRIRLDDPVQEWLPELADRQVLARPDGPLDETVPANRPITVRDVLTSTFGLGIDLPLMAAPIGAKIMEVAYYSTDAGSDVDPDAWLRLLGMIPLSHQPGQRWQYELSHDVLSMLVARVSGRPLGDFLAERVFGPLGMDDTGFWVAEDSIDRLPPSYVPDPATGAFHVWDEAAGGSFSKPPRFHRGGGGLVSTADDYHAYFRMLLAGGVHQGRRILSRRAVELMTTNRLRPDVQAARHRMALDHVHLSHGQGQHGGWGLGMAVRTERHDYAPLGQFGWDGGTGTSVYADPHHGVVGILLTQVGLSVPDPARLIHDFWTTVYRSVDA
ncbi:serine hydrolase domain-containing protein [Nonomuraea sp. NPDC050328]|uniref:serine hydrolase domain-containing protein n=1 Tax=Nonomuraea sp. NPDC050328 TaxID=3364361 RepID=UPI0037A6AE4A